LYPDTLISSAAWITMGRAGSVGCIGEDMLVVLLFCVLLTVVVLVVGFWSAMTGLVDDVSNLFVGGDYFSGEERAPQSLVLLDGFLSFNLKGSQVPLEVENEVKFDSG
jgi:hypothetical protein